RTCEEQDAIYAQGRTSSGTISTNARGCKSWHVLGRAVDADPFNPRTGEVFLGNSTEYRVLGVIWKKLGGVWGGDFSGLYDPGHFEWHPDKSIEDVCPENMSCYQLKVQNKVPIYLMASGAILLLTVGIFTATVTMKVPADALRLHTFGKRPFTRLLRSSHGVHGLMPSAPVALAITSPAPIRLHLCACANCCGCAARACCPQLVQRQRKPPCGWGWC